MIPRNVSVSEVATFLDCEQRWHYKYVLRERQLGGTAIANRFTRGTFIHAAVEAFIKGHPVTAEAFTMWAPDKPREWIEEQLAIAYFTTEALLREWDVQACEQVLHVQVPQYRRFVAVPDLVAVKKTEPFLGGLFTVDLKTYRDLKPDVSFLFDPQSVAYPYAANVNGVKVIGHAVAQVAYSAPSVPRECKSGEPHAGDMKRIREWAAVRRQTVVYRHLDEIVKMWNDVVLAALDRMHDIEIGLQRPLPEIGVDRCKDCDFVEPCSADLRGLDSCAILNAGFVRKPR